MSFKLSSRKLGKRLYKMSCRLCIYSPSGERFSTRPGYVTAINTSTVDGMLFENVVDKLNILLWQM